MEVTRPSTLEIMIMSGDNLCMGRNPVKENAFVVIRAESLKCCTTKMAKELGGGEGSSSSSLISWNEKFLMDIPMHARSITFEVQCKTSQGAVKNVGVARIAITDIFGTKFSGNSVRLLSYRLRDWDGRRSGVINFSVTAAKLPEDDDKPGPPMKVTPASCGGLEVNEKKPNGVTTGIPVW